MCCADHQGCSKIGAPILHEARIAESLSFILPYNSIQTSILGVAQIAFPALIAVAITWYIISVFLAPVTACTKACFPALTAWDSPFRYLLLIRSQGSFPFSTSLTFKVLLSTHKVFDHLDFSPIGYGALQYSTSSLNFHSF